MTTANNISTESTSLSRNSIEPSKWSEEQKRAYLLQINERENPEELPRLQQLFEQGFSADEIAKLCDEHGHLKYKDLEDPNALINRFNFVSLEKPHINTNPNKSTYDTEYYFPSIQAIHRTRELVAIVTKGHQILKDMPALITADDYRKYFASFDPATFEILVREMHVLEITKGCNGSCRSICATMTEGPVTATMPYEIVIELIDAHYKVSDKPLSLYYANDIADYKDGDKTGADIYKYLMSKHEETKNFQYIFTTYSLRPTNIDFIYRCITENLPLYRISHIVAGKRPGDLKKLLEKLEERAGRPLDPKEKNTIQIAFDRGERAGKVLMLGNAVKEDTPEQEISSEAINTTHEVAFKTGNGFMGQIVRPPSKKYPAGEMIWPITPNTKEQIIPEGISMPANSGPFQTSYDAFYQRPRLIRISNGVTTKDEPTPEEKRLEYFSRLLRNLNEEVGRHLLRDKGMKLTILTEKMKTMYINLGNAGINLPIKMTKEIEKEITLNIDHLHYAIELIGEAAEKYKDDDIGMDDLLMKIEKTYKYFDRVESRIEEMVIRLTLLNNINEPTPAINNLLGLCEKLLEEIGKFESFIENIFKPTKDQQ